MTTAYSPVIIYMNGFRVGQSDIESVMVSELDAFVYISGTQASKYDPSWGGVKPVSAQPSPVVLISTKFPVRNAQNVTADRPLGWQRPARFYTPKYETAAAKKAFEPMRATLHWEPSLRLENGEARFSFWTSDHQVPYRILLEGIAGSDKRPVAAGIVTK